MGGAVPGFVQAGKNPEAEVLSPRGQSTPQPLGVGDQASQMPSPTLVPGCPGVWALWLGFGDTLTPQLAEGSLQEVTGGQVGF